ncbi:UDP-3-O-acyl-N-acetylglucosamine deacetylase [Synechococcus sp. UW140]|uniref:UDP-3-O-acyl-N-acetylglucosamine deacetylase n=1 Tax=Synechococcus sp. UW140 TaxID=368503 RepID=UPI0025FD6BD1|nr:UDP-3-O-acyl-N-acetylglucosamine deacetylase [Synechococcus sp. UW140]
MFWPADYSRCFGLSSAVERRGIGLHSGEKCTLRLRPGAAAGFRVGWIDRPNDPPQLLDPSLVQDTRLCTALRLGDRKVATVEHLLAALAGTGITQAELWLDSEEVPLLDGSALPWVEAIAEAGMEDLGPRPPLPPLLQPITLQQGNSFVAALPSTELLLTAAIEFPQAAIGRQLFSLVLTPEAFVTQIAPARTFGFRDQVDKLLAAGLIKGGALDNALVCDGENWLNPPLRFIDEPVRHKLLDLIGDLALVGLPQAQVMAFRGSHFLHTQLAAALYQKQT